MSSGYSSYSPSPHAAATISLADVLGAMWRGRWIGLACFLVCVVMGVYMLGVLPPRYTASMQVAPRQPQRATFNATSLLSGLAAGLGTVDANFTLFLDSLQSRRLAKQLSDKGLLLKLYPNQWDSEHQRWIPPTGWWADTKAMVKQRLNLPPWTPPDYREVATYFRENVIVTLGSVVESQRDTYNIFVTAKDPILARELLEDIYWGAEAIVREQMRSDLTLTISHVQEILKQTTSDSVRQGLVSRLISDETQLALLVDGTPAATVIMDPPDVPKTPAFPNPRVTVMFSAVMGALLGLAGSMLYGFWITRRATSMRRLDETMWSSPTAPITAGASAQGQSGMLPPSE
jgi:uncharacterized protein involved in exopolysaccharide biosynthesis